MPLPGYGILYGTVRTVRPPRASETHWLLIVQPLDAEHPAYRVAIQLTDAKVGIQAQWFDLSQGGQAAKNVAGGLQATYESNGVPQYFLTAQDSMSGQQVPGFDYIRSGIVDFTKFSAGGGENDPAAAKFADLVRPGAKVVVCGTGLPVNDDATGAPSTGYTAIGNVHMNQGTRTWISNGDHHDENGPNQDGALFVLEEDSVWGLFLKYASQSINTDANGDPQDSGVASIDSVSVQAQPVVKKYLQARSAEDAATAAVLAQRSASDPAKAANGFVFQNPAGSDENDPFVADDDHAVINNQVSQEYAQGKIRAPEYIKGNQSLVMKLEDVRGAAYVGTLANHIAFDFIGDTGATSAATYAGEKKVSAQLSALSKNDPPAFCFHVGDVVYFYGEANYFPCQFGVPFKDYPAPIFAVPGNHDACVYDDQHKPLEAFIDVFCADQPARSGILGGASRTTMTQPGVYFTLDAPFVSIVGLFSGAAESQRYMSAQQIQHFYSEMLRLAQLRKQGDKRAVILAVHHLPQFYAAKPDAVSTGLDAACEHAKFWPDAVVVGHAHLYQRFVRTVGSQQIPYIVVGNGGYRISPGQDAKVAGHNQVSDNLVKKVLGFMRASCDGQTLSFRAIDENGQNIDQLGVDLATQKVSL